MYFTGLRGHFVCSGLLLRLASFISKYDSDQNILATFALRHPRTVCILETVSHSDVNKNTKPF
jgi:hypothetical protein